MNPFSLAPNAALVTGSSRGIGLAVARGLEAAGARVVYHGHEAAPAEFPTDRSHVQCDLLRPDAPAELIRRAFSAEPGLDLLVCNAGAAADAPFLETSAELWDRTMQLNVRATYFLVQQFARELAARGRPGAVVITSSTNGFQPEPGCSVYDTSKGALVMMTRALALELAPFKIRVNGIAPGLIRTPLTTPFLEQHPDRQRHYEKKILLERLGEAEDCAGAVTFLLSPAAAYITGHIIVIDGGLTVGQVGKL